MYNKVDTNMNFVEREKATEKFWEDNDIFRKSMENGEFFSVSHYSNGVELNGMREMPNFDEAKIDEVEGYNLNNTPMVTRVTVDQENDTISVEGINFDEITWVSNCNVIKLEHNQFVSTNRNAAVELRITLEAFGTEHKEEIMKALEKNGYQPKLVRTNI